MTAIESCRTAALGGHVDRCQECAHTRVSYNSCRHRCCPKCQWTTAAAWLASREDELLPVRYLHLVFTLPPEVGTVAYQNKATVYGLLLKAAAETLIATAANLGAEIGVTAILHTWGQNLQQNPHSGYPALSSP
jgi:Transposase zinc-binding domain